jgi:Fic family protein
VIGARSWLFNFQSPKSKIYIVLATIYDWISDLIHIYPKLDAIDQDVLGLLREQRRALRHQVNANPVRWTGFLRRNTFARAVQGSNSIEGYNANLAEAVAIVDDERPETLEEETVRALQNYRVAMTYVVSVHADPHMKINTQFIRGLHFMMMNYDMTKLPGQWRIGPIHVVRDPANQIVYEGPDAEQVSELMEALCAQADAADAADSSTVLAAMAHLNLAMIHPFKDGNGRMARALQTLVIARNGIVAPELSSIEEWLGRNTEAYYEVLGEVGQGRWSPDRSALPWVRFCLKAHHQQASNIMRRHATIGRAWSEIEKIRLSLGLPERCESPMMDAAFGYRVRNQRHRETSGISEVVASRDLKRLTEAGLVIAMGEKRGRFYLASDKLKSIVERSIEREQPIDPYKIIQRRDSDAQLFMKM